MQNQYEMSKEEMQNPGDWKEGDICFVITSKKKKYALGFIVLRYDGEFYWTASMNRKRAYRMSPSRMFRTKEEAVQSIE